MSRNRATILAASLALLEEKGLEGLSFREVARRAGVSHQAPYHVFGTKAAILAAVAQEGFQRLEEVVAQLPPVTGIQGIRQLGHAYIAFAFDHPAHYAVMHRPDLTQPEQNPDLLAAQGGLQGRLERAIHELRDHGHGLDQDPTELVHLLSSLLHGVVTAPPAGASDRAQNPNSHRVAATGAMDAFADLLVRAYS